MTPAPFTAPLRARAGTVRVRTTMAAVVIVGVALLAGGIALVVAMRQTLTNEARTAAGLRAADVAAALESGEGTARLAVGDPEELVIQVLDGAGGVLASSPNYKGPSLGPLIPGASKTVRLALDSHPFIAVAAPADTPDGRRTVIVARTLDTVGESTGLVRRLLAIGLPLLLLVVAATTWKLVGGALAPVEAIRKEVDEISAAELHRRVPHPAGADEIARLAVTMNQMLQRLQDAQERQRRFISDASHELKSPVATVRQHAEVAIAHPGRTTVEDLAGTVLVENLRLQALVEDLLLLARADEHTLNLRRRPVDVDDLVFEEARRLRAASAIAVDTAAVSAGQVEGDVASLRRVLRNLADNAARHARTGVAFSLAEVGGAVVLDIDDDGPGIPTGDRERVMERFVRLDDARGRDDGGGGLGLAIVAELVTAHGGTVAIDDSPLGGTRVRIRFKALLQDGA